MRSGLFVCLVTLATAGGYEARVSRQPGGPTSACTVAGLTPKAPMDTTIVRAEMVPASGAVPRHCRVDGHVTVPGNTVSFRLGLPDDWNGKYYFQGVGGLGGTIGSLDTGLARGYAAASTDTGHQATDATWGKSRAKEIDYGYRGTHVTAVAAKALTNAYYGRQPRHAYFNGCSNGGRQALMEVQRYPWDFDGVIAGHPAMGTPMQVGRAIVYQHMLSAADNYIPAEKVELLDRATLAACDATDGLTDGLISDPRLCTFTPDTLLCAGADEPECLTEGQVETVKLIYAGVRTRSGEQVSPPLPIGHEGGGSGWQQWITGSMPPVRRADGMLDFPTSPPAGFRLQQQNFDFLGNDEDDPAFTWRRVDVDRLGSLQVMTQILSPTDADLRPYRDRGGKLILYHGWADPGISAYGTLSYYERMVSLVGGQQRADEFVRLFLAPGMRHCSGGPGPNQFDMLTALEAWVEHGMAPDRVIASHSTGGRVDRTRPLCAHPRVARYVGPGSVDEAASFRCEVAQQR